MTDEKHSIQQIIMDDKRTASDVVEAASKELREDVILFGPPDITGAPTIGRSFNRWKEQQLAAVKTVRRELYFAKIEVNIRDPRDRIEHRKYLVTKARFDAGLHDDDWSVIAWTAPITANLIDRDVGHTFEYQPARSTKHNTFTIESGAKYGKILPHVLETTYRFADADIYVQDERTLGEEPAEHPECAPPAPYEAAEDFGLTEIIELADVTQREVMHLPFRDSVLVDGPPGSGKTSIGLMRIPCLIDRQWQELERNPAHDSPFHEFRTMCVLVLNEEMVDYLDKLLRSVGVHDVPVRTLDAFCQRICRDARTLTGRRVRESPRLTHLKLHRLALPAYWAGLRNRTSEIWDRCSTRLERVLESQGGEYGILLYKRLNQWVASIKATEDPADAPPTSINLPHVLRLWRNDCTKRRDGIRSTMERERVSELLPRLQRLSLRLARRFLDRHRIIRAARTCAEFHELCAAALDERDRVSVVDEWMKQAARRQISEADFVLTAWLATYVSYVPTDNDRQGIGFVKQSLTHVVIDEAQDVSHCHLAAIRRLLSEDGTITLVGDLRQRLTAHSYFDSWEELSLGPIVRAAFTVNHWQSQPLGEFVRDLHNCLYGEPPQWRASRRSGPKPRIRRQRGNAHLADAVTEEVRYWREQIPNATVGILFHGKKWEGLGRLKARVERGLEDTVTSLYLAVGAGRAHYLRRTDCAMIASVRGTKGLEFDAVVVIDPHRVWRRPLQDIPTVWRNAMYVAASRAKQGLTVIVDDRSVLMDGGIDPEYFDVVDQQGGSREESDKD